MTEQVRVDWELAARLGARVAPPAPNIPAEEISETVAALRADAIRSTGLVRDFTGLDAREDAAPVLVVDRPRWIEANAQSFGQVLQPFLDKLSEKKSGVAPAPVRRAGAAVGARVTGVEVGALLGLLSGKVLGQFDPFAPADVAPEGRLLLVAPNVWQVAEQINADHADFRLWVCLHEETHRVQFTTVPWLRDHLRGQIGALAGSIDPSSAVSDTVSRAVEAVRSGTLADGSLVDLLGSPEQKEIIDAVTGVMSLLEGHADVVMDGVGPEVIPTVRRIRRAFERRRDGVGFLDRTLRRLLGLEAKMAQYRDGARFVRHVVDRVGMDDFNAVWTSPATLPSKAEIGDPDVWIARVLA